LITYLLVTNFQLFAKTAREFDWEFSRHPIFRNEERFAGIRKDLSGKKVIGYFSDEHHNIGDYYGTQYALSPIIVARDVQREWVVGNFIKSERIPQDAEKKGLFLMRDYGNGIVLYWRKGE
jgi:hypothetical protein